MVLIKSVQSEPLKGVPLHVDFVSIKEGQTVVVSGPLEVVMESVMQLRKIEHTSIKQFMKLKLNVFQQAYLLPVKNQHLRS